MEKFFEVLGAALVVAMGIFFLVIVGTLFGAICGWIVGLFFGETILHVLAQFGVRSVTMWQFGTFMGFVGGFLRSIHHCKGN